MKKEIVVQRGNTQIIREATDDGRIDDFFYASRPFSYYLSIGELVHEVNRLAKGVTYWPMMEHLVRTGRTTFGMHTSH